MRWGIRYLFTPQEEYFDMTHEFKKIIAEYGIAAKADVKCVLATVVTLDGSSYRRPGVRMLLLENGKMVGAVSGGCVEKEVFRQAASVFKSGMAKVMTYDGRYRLGCEGVLYILLEPMELPATTHQALVDALASRAAFELDSHFEKAHSENHAFGTVLKTGDHHLPFRNSLATADDTAIFQQKMEPCFRLVIAGAEHDTVQLCSLAAMMGWTITVIVHPKEEKELIDFPGASELIADEGENLNLVVDKETAIVIMTHSYVKDLKYLQALKDVKPLYLGLLGPSRRREKLFNELIEMHPDMDWEFLEHIHGPAGLDIGAETPQEIALSILSEIIAVANEKSVHSLKEKAGRIHA